MSRWRGQNYDLARRWSTSVPSRIWEQNPGTDVSTGYACGTVFGSHARHEFEDGLLSFFEERNNFL